MDFNIALMKGYPFKLKTDSGFEASFGSFKDAVDWFKLGRYDFASVVGTTKAGHYVYLAELGVKEGKVEIWKAYE